MRYITPLSLIKKKSEDVEHRAQIAESCIIYFKSILRKQTVSMEHCWE